MKKAICLIPFLLSLATFIACSDDANTKSDPAKKDEQSVIEKKQHEIATEAVQNMKEPIDKAKAVSAGEEERNKEINKAFGN